MSDRASTWLARARAVPAFAGMDPADTARLLATATPLSLRDDQAVFSRGDVANAVYLVLSGTVRISTLGASGKRITVEIFQRDEVFGEIGAIDGAPRTADATAMGPVELLGISTPAFRAVLRDSAALANNQLAQMTLRLRRTYSLLEDASLRGVEQRLAKQVLYLMKLGATGQGALRLQVRMHQDELADLLGVTTRSIINVLNKWRAEDLVTFDGRMAQITIRDIDRFRALTEE